MAVKGASRHHAAVKSGLLGLLLLVAAAGSVRAGPVNTGLGLFHQLTSAWNRGLGFVKAQDHHSLGSLQSSSSDATDDDAEDFADADDSTVHAHWALIIAGSNGWGNYRHQADACHAYQVLRRGGYHPSRIVLMVYDDIADNMLNPYPGKIFNRPGGEDVYEGIVPDYSGQDVSADTFLAVLAGDARAVKGKGNGKVINSGPNDRVFVFYSDHGAPGILGMPSGSFLYADKLISTIKDKRQRNGFKEMVLYIEACESGSIFEGLLDSHQGVYAVTAANSEESSWGTYCPTGDRSSAPDVMGTCLGDLFSVAWMENAEEVDLRTETLLIQFFLVRMRTSNNFTYIMGSHAMQFGALKMQKERAGDYQGTHNTGVQRPTALPAEASNGAAQGLRPKQPHHAVGQRDADLVPLRHAYETAQSSDDKMAAKAALDREVSRRAMVDSVAQHAAIQLLRLPRASQVLMRSMGVTAKEAFSRSAVASQQVSLVAATGDNGLLPNAGLVSLLLSSPLPGREVQGKPLVDSWDCLRAMVKQWEDSCGPMDQYTMRHTRLLANLCNAGLQPDQLGVALAGSGCMSGQPVAAA